MEAATFSISFAMPRTASSRQPTPRRYRAAGAYSGETTRGVTSE